MACVLLPLHVSMAWPADSERYRRQESVPLESQTPKFDKSWLTRKSCQHMSSVCNEYLALSHVCSANTLCDRSQFKEYCYAKKFRRVVKTPISVSLVRFFQFSRLTKRQLSCIILLVLWSSFRVGIGEARMSFGTWVYSLRILQIVCILSAVRIVIKGIIGPDLF